MTFDHTDEPCWYVIHTYSGYENRVKDGIEATINNRDLSDQILEIRIPTQEIVETQDGKTTVTEKLIFPGYVMVKMYLDADIWYIIRNTRGVTGFVGPEGEPTPLKEEELISMGLIQPEVVSQYQVGERITVIDGPLTGVEANIEEVMPAQSKVRVNVSIFGRMTPTELEFSQIRKNQ